MCEPLPAPAVPKLIGLPCDDLTNSLILPAWVAGGAESDSGLEPTIATVARSSAAKPLFLCIVSLIASAVVVTRMVWPSAADPATVLAATLPPARRDSRRQRSGRAGRRASVRPTGRCCRQTRRQRNRRRA